MATKATAALPRDLRWRIHVGLAAIFVCLVFTVGIAWAQHAADDQFIGPDELKQNLQELESYSAEADYLSQYYQNKSAARPYVEAYASQLQEAVDSVAEKLSEHPHADALNGRTNRTISLAGQLSNQLQQLMAQPVWQLPQHADQAFDKLSDEFQNLEEDL